LGKRRYASVAVGGTFDVLHKGHRALLRKALEVGEKVLVGLTSDEMVRSSGKKHEVDPYEVREKALIEFFREERALDRVEIIPLYDKWGITTTSPDLEALVVSSETEPVGREINRIRESRGLKPLAIVTIDRVLAEDGEPISSTRIRLGEIDREGRSLKPRSGNATPR